MPSNHLILLPTSPPILSLSQHLLELDQTHVHWFSDVIQQSCPLSSPSPPAFNLSQHQGLFKWASSSHQVTKVLELQPEHQSLHEYSRLISFRIDWFDLLAVQETLKSVSRTPVQKYQFFSTQPSLWSNSQHLYRTTGKTIALTILTFVGKVMSLLFNMLSKFVIAFLSRSKHLLISWLQSPFAVI